ncbi:hypothetical protein GDO81_021898 [Engystomops pustulosus]|uniref:Uncharacterized protein n=1 Tax=Engystomops pustulosus TaxID=76066 RepID=A0AAV6ZUV0_ENGPU|nr:hypothetical protein GDO81_021898 [Engystomops pustulosus]
MRRDYSGWQTFYTTEIGRSCPLMPYRRNFTFRTRPISITYALDTYCNLWIVPRQSQYPPCLNILQNCYPHLQPYIRYLHDTIAPELRRTYRTPIHGQMGGHSGGTYITRNMATDLAKGG